MQIVPYLEHCEKGFQNINTIGFIGFNCNNDRHDHSPVLVKINFIQFLLTCSLFKIYFAVLQFFKGQIRTVAIVMV